MFYPFYDPTYILLLPAIIFAMYAQAKVKSTFSKYLRVPANKGYTGYQVARAILDQNGLRNIPVQIARGYLSDHYDPRSKVLRLSNDVYYGTSVASISVAAHEVGHAIQHAYGYAPLGIRNAIFPVASFASSAAFPLAILGLIVSLPGLVTLGILLYVAAVLFQIITLPVEFNASSRALRLLDDNGFVMGDEYRASQKVLRAAALTYVAAMATAVANLLRLLVLRSQSERR